MDIISTINTLINENKTAEIALLMKQHDLVVEDGKIKNRDK